jgi:DNA excision repair protein ERCC-2
MRNFFPHPFREGQKELIRFIQKEVWKGSVCVDAPTGYGKTLVILAALLPYAEDRGTRIIWAVRTGTETDRPIEELKEINRRKGTKFFGLSYRGKRDMCLLAREAEVEMDHDEVSFLCRMRGEECKYRQNFDYFEPAGLAKGPLLYSEILSFCREQEVCPYLVQRELLPHADVVSLNYNYIIDKRMAWSIRREVPFERSFLVVDEAHNLQYACSNIFSDRITLGTATAAAKEAGTLGTRKAQEAGRLANRIEEELKAVMRKMKGEEEEFDAARFFTSLAGPKMGLEDLFDKFKDMRDCGTRVRREQLRLGRRPRSSLFHLANFCLSSMESLETRGVAFLASKEKNNLVIERWDMRAAEVLRERWAEFLGCIFCSGTLAPLKAFAETVGLEVYAGRHVPSNFPPQNVISLITRSLTTKGESLSREMAENYVEAIGDFAKSLNANVAVFSASYRIQDELLKSGLKETIEGLGMRFFKEKQGMSGDASRKILEGFKACARNGEPGFLCATATGRFAEGADFPGEELQGVFLVGIPFERMSVRTKLYIDYYRELYGARKGTYYAYVVPALRRASQCLGRALRSKEDRAALVCGDERYGERRFLRLLPDYVQANVEVVGRREMRKKLSSWASRNLKRK